MTSAYRRGTRRETRAERGVRRFVRLALIVTFFLSSGWIAPAFEARYDGHLPGLSVRREARSDGRPEVRDGSLSWTMLATPEVVPVSNPYLSGAPSGRSHTVVHDPITEKVEVWDLPSGPIDPLVVLRRLSGVEIGPDDPGIKRVTAGDDHGLAYGFQSDRDTALSRWSYVVALIHGSGPTARLVVITISTFNLPPSRYDEDRARDDARGHEYTVLLESYDGG